MAETLQDADRDRLTAYLERHLLRAVPLDGLEIPALRETHAPFATAQWCWTADAAGAVELLSQPGLAATHGPMRDGLTDFLLAMGTGNLLLRRVAEAGLVVDNADPRNFAITTATHEFRGDLSRGVVRQAVRSAPARREFHHTGHLAEFRLSRTRHCIDVEDNIDSFGLEQRPDGVMLFHESVLRGSTGLLRKTEQVVGRVRYEYWIEPSDPRLLVQVTLRAEPGITLSDVRLTTAADELSGEALRPVSRVALGEGREFRHRALSGSAVSAVLEGKTADIISLIEDAPPGAANGLHLRPLSGERLLNVKAQSVDGRLHWLILRYALPELAGGASFQVNEARLLTAGTLAAAMPSYAGILYDPSILSGRDAGVTADHGVALNAVATQLLFHARGAYPLPEERVAMLRDWYDRHLDGLFAGMAEGDSLPARRSYLRSLSFALLSLDAMQRHAPEPRYEAALRHGLDLLLSLQRPDEQGGAFADQDQAAYLDCHAAAMLALSRIAMSRQDARLLPALKQALGAIRVGSVKVPLEEGLHSLDTPFVRSRRSDGRWEDDGGFWSFKLGLLLRALATMKLARQSGALALEGSQLQRLQTLNDLATRQLRARIRPLGGTLEVLTSPVAQEGNAATQPAAVLGLLTPDAAVAAPASAEQAA
ncbi:hypothetical protein ACFOD4_13525 [Pseudoroseomonas globiformis]|uniref:Uncharacterized protein n=1 Tax=Teichococcus globiformis TaxID=2307229 RepID=A0ABV7G4Z0_9PROT